MPAKHLPVITLALGPPKSAFKTGAVGDVNWKVSSATAYEHLFPADDVYSLYSHAKSYGELPDYGGATNERLMQELSALRLEVRRLSSAIEALASRGADVLPGVEAPSAVRMLSASEARDEIVSYLAERSEAYPSDIANELNLDYDLVTEVLDALREEGAAAPKLNG
jgi:hypothetical protein